MSMACAWMMVIKSLFDNWLSWFLTGSSRDASHAKTVFTVSTSSMGSVAVQVCPRFGCIGLVYEGLVDLLDALARRQWFRLCALCQPCTGQREDECEYK